MMFPVLRNESVVQVNDQTRLDASRSYSAGVAVIDTIEIDPDGSGYIDVSAMGFIDYQYPTPGVKTVLVRVDNGTTPVVGTFTLTVVTEADDKLIANDNTLSQYEPDILTYVRPGRNSFKDVHRRVQKLILDWLDSNRYWKRGKDRFTAADLIDIQDFTEWSALWALALIYEGLSDKVDDKWMQKALKYKALAESASERGTLRLDTNADGVITDGEKTDNVSKGLIRA